MSSSDEERKDMSGSRQDLEVESTGWLHALNPPPSIHRRVLLARGLFALGIGIASIGLVLSNVVVLLGGLGVAVVGQWLKLVIRIDRDLEAQNRRAGRLEQVQGWHVHLHLFQGPVLTGLDEGIAWFEDGRLFYLGNLTSFSLTREQIRDVGTQPWALRFVHAPIEIRTVMHGPFGPITVGFEIFPAKLKGQFLAQSSSTFLSALRGLGEDKTGMPLRLPPVSLGPKLPSLRALKFLGFAPAIVIVGLVVLSLAVPPLFFLIPPLYIFPQFRRCGEYRVAALERQRIVAGQKASQ